MRIVGALLILCSAAFIAYGAVLEIQRALRTTIALRIVMEQVKNLIECYSLPIGRIFKKIDPLVIEACGYKGEALPTDLSELAENSVVPDKESLEIFLAFAKDFGKGYRKDELSRCSMFLERMRSREQKLSKETEKKKRVIVAISICGALAVVILLI